MRRLIVENEVMHGFILDVDQVKKGIRDSDGRVAATAIRIGISNDAASLEDIEYAITHPSVEVRLAATLPAIQAGLLTEAQVRGIFEEKFSVEAIDIKIEAKVGLIGFYLAKTGIMERTSDQTDETLEEAIRNGKASVRQIQDILFKSNDFGLVRRVTEALIVFYAENAYYAKEDRN